MGKITNGILGPISGKIGNLVYYNVNGKQLVRKLGKITRPPTPAQLQNRKEMKTVMQFLSPLTEFLNAGFIPSYKERHKTAFSMAVAYNKKNAVTGTNPDIGIAYEKVRLSEGNLEEAIAPTAEMAEEGLKFSWLCPADLDWPANTDRVMLLAYFPNLKTAVYLTSAAQRQQLTETLKLAENLRAEYMEIYISFVAENRKSAANSTYLGSFNEV
ncbi:ABC-type sugar transport system ATPase subunit [Pedobacter africanus]|uniref:ABC-type sugar transport system ATPase subunit n=1 Tax=Pedobacter africanus TaxID=151894 RepID=A0ACC6KWY6_9SPHI|nr:DUF6266 family protein [Pedobacter africanus]MDR6783756.1 ABC-type sugar transport system ATPase subunit [Pedobacter africanus]